MNKIIVNIVGGVLLDIQKGGSALGLSPSKSPRGGLRQGKEVTPYD